jgi:voltage-gated potassium channel
MNNDKLKESLRNFAYAFAALITVFAVATVGYWILGDGNATLLDSLFMTVITIAGIGYGEITEGANTPHGRAFTIFVTISGIIAMTYIVTNVTAFLVEGHLNNFLRRKHMQKRIEKLKDHYIVCGVDGVGKHILGELATTGREALMVDISPEKLERAIKVYDIPHIEGDATDENILRQAAIERAAGLFVATGDDNINLVIVLTARQIAKNIRIVCCIHNSNNMDKARNAGANSVVSPTFIGGLRMASEMVRPTVVTFLDIMLRDKQKNLRIEEVAVPRGLTGKKVAALELKTHPHTLLMSIKHDEDWTYNPGDDYELSEGDVLVFMTTPGARTEIERLINSAANEN